MPEVNNHGARGGNWALARYCLGQIPGPFQDWGRKSAPDAAALGGFQRRL